MVRVSYRSLPPMGMMEACSTPRNRTGPPMSCSRAKTSGNISAVLHSTKSLLSTKTSIGWPLPSMPLLAILDDWLNFVGRRSSLYDRKWSKPSRLWVERAMDEPLLTALSDIDVYYLPGARETSRTPKALPPCKKVIWTGTIVS